GEAAAAPSGGMPAASPAALPVHQGGRPSQVTTCVSSGFGSVQYTCTDHSTPSVASWLPGLTSEGRTFWGAAGATCSRKVSWSSRGGTPSSVTRAVTV